MRDGNERKDNKHNVFASQFIGVAILHKYNFVPEILRHGDTSMKKAPIKGLFAFND